MAAALAERAAELFLGVAEFLDQAAVALAFLDRVEILPLDVLDQRDLGRAAIVHLADDHRNLVQPCRLRRAPAPLTGKNLVAIGLRRIAAHEDRLQDSLLAHRLGQRVEVLGIEMTSRLKAAWLQLLYRQAALAILLLRRCCGRFLVPEERGKPAPQATRAFQFIGAAFARRLLAHDATAGAARNRPRSRFKTSLAR